MDILISSEYEELSKISFAIGKEKKKIEIVCRNEEAADIVDTIRKSAHTGRHGDGKIFVTEVLEAVDIRTGEQGEKAV